LHPKEVAQDLGAACGKRAKVVSFVDDHKVRQQQVFKIAYATTNRLEQLARANHPGELGV